MMHRRHVLPHTIHHSHHHHSHSHSGAGLYIGTGKNYDKPLTSSMMERELLGRHGRGTRVGSGMKHSHKKPLVFKM